MPQGCELFCVAVYVIGDAVDFDHSEFSECTPDQMQRKSLAHHPSNSALKVSSDSSVEVDVSFESLNTKVTVLRPVLPRSSCAFS
jgi:hypothetical protein